MRLNFVHLVFAVFCYKDVIGLDWSLFAPWRKDIPKEEFKNHISLRLVRKDWMPKGPNLPEGDEISPQYAGSVHEVFAMFLDKDNVYDFHERPLENAVELLTEDYGFNPELESIFIIHTISRDVHNYLVKNMMIVLALRNLMKHYNVFAFNMPTLNESMELTVFQTPFGLRGNYKELGETIGDFFNVAIQKDLIKPDQIHLYGYCYSSQLSGYVARYISSKNNKQKIKSITGLDPYSILFSGIRHKVLSKKDAQLVYIYHTNSIIFGTLYRKATADINLNSGMYQPGCYRSNNRKCSHRRAVTAFWYMILYPDLWLARKCPDWLLFKSCLCNWNSTVQPTFPPTPGAKGSYFLNTMSHKPYGYGPSGANCYTRNNEPKTQSGSNGNTIEFENYQQF